MEGADGIEDRGVAAQPADARENVQEFMASRPADRLPNPRLSATIGHESKWPSFRKHDHQHEHGFVPRGVRERQTAPSAKTAL